jgi:hypothetical protein
MYKFKTSQLKTEAQVNCVTEVSNGNEEKPPANTQVDNFHINSRIQKLLAVFQGSLLEYWFPPPILGGKIRF